MRYLLIVIVLAVALVAALFMVPVDHGRPLLNWQYAKNHWQQPEQWLDDPKAVLNSHQSHARELYRWRDGAGNWQYGQIPPSGVQAEPVTVKAPTTITSEQMRGGQGVANEQQQ
ncbi:MAG: DUF4124 domain-containing protein [Alcanivorax sp.]|nr:DUF4124 domain-containing protein [Alcanivorax sp.]